MIPVKFWRMFGTSLWYWGDGRMDEQLKWPVYLVRQGRPEYDNLMKLCKSETWLRETLAQVEIYDIRDVRYALLDHRGAVHILHT
jgi:uncharacterized membrane protein YcaP (DUF421 family)